jgi:hypothetical protein
MLPILSIINIVIITKVVIGSHFKYCYDIGFTLWVNLFFGENFPLQPLIYTKHKIGHRLHKIGRREFPIFPSDFVQSDRFWLFRVNEGLRFIYAYVRFRIKHKTKIHFYSPKCVSLIQNRALKSDV